MFVRKLLSGVALGALLMATPFQTAAAAGQIQVAVDQLNLRSGPGMTYQVLETLPKSVTLPVLAEQNEWVHVRLANGKTGWVIKKYVTQIGQKPPAQGNGPIGTTSGQTTAGQAFDYSKGIVRVTQLTSAYTFPSTTSGTVGQLSEGDTIPVFGEQNGWVSIRFDGNQAWIPKVHTTPQSQLPIPAGTQASTIKVTADKVNVRSQPTTNSQILSNVSIGTQFSVVEKTGDWYKVRLTDGSLGYIAGWLVQPNGQVATAPTYPQTGSGGSGGGAFISDGTGTQKVFIYHTHNRESWRGIASNNQGTSIDDATNNITLVGNRLGELLQQRGIETGVSLDDIARRLAEKKKSYTASYAESLQTVLAAASQNPTLEYYFDLHRDSDVPRERTTTTINGQDYARILFVIGTKNTNYAENKRLADDLHAYLESMYPGLSRGVLLKGSNEGNGEYNQSISPGSLLLEIGGANNTIEECYRTAEAFADAFSNYYVQMRAQIQ
ncbi:MAG: stage II sporulation protein P [Clostridia bacterium]